MIKLLLHKALQGCKVVADGKVVPGEIEFIDHLGGGEAVVIMRIVVDETEVVPIGYKIEDYLK